MSTLVAQSGEYEVRRDHAKLIFIRAFGSFTENPGPDGYSNTDAGFVDMSWADDEM